MALVTRLTRLFRADMHAVLDRIEEPDLLLKQAVRDMEAALAEDERRLRLLQHELGELQVREGDLALQLKAIEEELDVCFLADNEALARSLIRRRLEQQRTHKQVTRRIESREREIDSLGKRLRDQQDQLESMRQKAELLTPQASETPVGQPAATTVRDEEVEIAFLREKQKRSAS